MHCRAKGATVLAGVREVTAAPNSNVAVKALENRGVIVHHLDITNERSARDFRDEVKRLLEERGLGERYKIHNRGKYVR